MMPDSLNTIASRFLDERHRLLAYILAGVRDPHTAEDIFQEVWMRLATAVESGAAIQHEAAWCRATARNLLLHHWRRESRDKVEVNSDLLDVLDSLESALEENADTGDLWAARQQALTGCLVALPEKSRRMLALKYEAGLPLEEVARSCGQSLSAITKTLYRLRRALMDCVQNRLGLGEEIS
ncbi:MAG: sigma-70 family RNA polymerase sigma factor [Prosthecobacter sp.]